MNISSKSLSKDRIFLIISILLLIPTLFFPMFGDIAIFLEAGRVIANGGKIYVDYIDIKPLTFYYFFAIIYKLFGYSEIGIRIFSLIWQLFTIILLNQIVSKQLNNNLLGSLAAVIYSISYTVLGYNSSVTPESFLGLFILVSFYFFDKLNNRNAIYIGIIIGIAISFKYTFGVILVVFIILNWEYYRKFFFKYSTLMLISSLSILLLNFLPLLNSSVFQGFNDVNNFLKFYSSIPPINNEFIKYVLTQTSNLLTYYYSMTFFIIMIIGLYISSTDKVYKEKKIIIGSILLAIFLFLTIIIEKKLSVFHYPRLLLPFSILTAIGFNGIIKLIEWKKLNFIGRYLLVITIPLMIIFSPLPRYMKEVINTKAYLTNDLDSKYQIDGDNVVIRESYKNTANYIRPNAKPGDFIKVISIGGNMINYFLSEFRGSALPQSCFYYGEYKIKNWQELHNAEIKKSDWIIVQNNDNHPIINGHNRTSYESLQYDTLNNNYVQENFIQDTIIKPFIVFKRK